MVIVVRKVKSKSAEVLVYVYIVATEDITSWKIISSYLKFNVRYKRKSREYLFFFGKGYYGKNM
jgi:hypothetical protein